MTTPSADLPQVFSLTLPLKEMALCMNLMNAGLALAHGDIDDALTIALISRGAGNKTLRAMNKATKALLAELGRNEVVETISFGDREDG